MVLSIHAVAEPGGWPGNIVSLTPSTNYISTLKSKKSIQVLTL